MTQKDFENNVATLRLRMVKQAYSLLKDADEAEDAVQETLLKLWQMRDRIPDRTHMEHLASVVVRNTSISLLRRKTKCTTVPIDANGSKDMAVTPATAQQKMEEKEAEDRISMCILSLPDKQRAIIHMRNVEQLSYADIARIIGTTESSVRGMICRARSTLMMMLKNRC